MLSTFYPLTKKALFSMEPECAHHFSLDVLRRFDSLGLLGLASDSITPSPVECMGLTFPNPVGLAAGMDKAGDTIDAFGTLGFGFVEIGTLTPKPQGGNPKPRMFRLPEHDALINRMGFNNPGVVRGVENTQKSKRYKGIVGINIGKNKATPNEDAVADYLTCLRESYAFADYITVNLSSPNTPGLRDLQNEDETARLLNRLRKEQEVLEKEYGKHVPITLKIAPDLAEDHVTGLAKVFRTEGLEGLIATNTTISRELVKGHQYADEAGGLSGAPVTDPATKIIAAFAAEFNGDIPIIGVGGIMTADDAISKFEAGATLVQLYTGFVYHGPKLIHDCVAAHRSQKSC